LIHKSDPIDLGEKDNKAVWALNNEKAPISPIMAYDKLPKYLKDIIYDNA